jgi:hypothetical protein
MRQSSEGEIAFPGRIAGIRSLFCNESCHPVGIVTVQGLAAWWETDDRVLLQMAGRLRWGITLAG